MAAVLQPRIGPNSCRPTHCRRVSGCVTPAGRNTVCVCTRSFAARPGVGPCSCLGFSGALCVAALSAAAHPLLLPPASCSRCQRAPSPSPFFLRLSSFPSSQQTCCSASPLTTPSVSLFPQHTHTHTTRTHKPNPCRCRQRGHPAVHHCQGVWLGQLLQHAGGCLRAGPAAAVTHGQPQELCAAACNLPGAQEGQPVAVCMATHTAAAQHAGVRHSRSSAQRFTQSTRTTGAQHSACALHRTGQGRAGQRKAHGMQARCTAQHGAIIGTSSTGWLAGAVEEELRSWRIQHLQATATPLWLGHGWSFVGSWFRAPSTAIVAEDCVAHPGPVSW